MLLNIQDVCFLGKKNGFFELNTIKSNLHGETLSLGDDDITHWVIVMPGDNEGGIETWLSLL